MYQNQYYIKQFLHFDEIWSSLEIGGNIEKLMEIWKLTEKLDIIYSMIKRQVI